MGELVLGQRVQLRGKEPFYIIPRKARGIIIAEDAGQVWVAWTTPLTEDTCYKPVEVLTNRGVVLHRNVWCIQRPLLKAI